MKLNSLSTAVLFHGIAALGYCFVFVLEAFGISLPLLSLEAQHPNFMSTQYSQAASLFAALALLTFACYEMFFIPSYLSKSNDNTSRKKIKRIFVAYHIPWSIMITYLALLDGSSWTAWISVGVMYGFTLWGAISE